MPAKSMAFEREGIYRPDVEPLVDKPYRVSFDMFVGGDSLVLFMFAIMVRFAMRLV